MKKKCMVLLVDNNAGVLARISSLFVQRGFNIDSLTVSPTEVETLSRITIETTGDEKTLNQIMKQTAKLYESKIIFSVEPEFSLIREILLVKFAADNKNMGRIEQVIEGYGARIVDNTGGCFVVELSDTPHNIDSFLEDIKGLELVEMCRSGAIAMERGNVAYDI